MHPSLKTPDQYSLFTSENSPEPLSAISKLLDTAQVDGVDVGALGLFQNLTFQELQLGQEIFSCDTSYAFSSLSSPSQKSVYPEHSDTNLYFICQGRIRLLCPSLAQGKEIPALLLEAGETVGADSILLAAPIPTYRAIAASTVQIAQISESTLQHISKQYPKLYQHFIEQAQERERVLFFKALTSLGSLPGRQLREWTACLTSQDVAAGSLLSEATPSEAGCFWLRWGTIQHQTAPERSPTLGSCWGHPQGTPSDWIAQTNLQVYALSPDQWDKAKAILPEWEQMQAIARDSNPSGLPSQNGHSPSASVISELPTPASLRRSRPTAAPRPQPPINIPEAPEPEFPQPQASQYRQFALWRRYPFIQQQSIADCGVTCLAMISKYWGRRFSLNFLRELAGVGRSGTSLKNLSTAAESLGFYARPVRASLSPLESQRNPWIAHWQGDHYVVVYRVRRRQILIADPAVGRRWISRQQFLNSWTGYALLLDPTSALKTQKEEKQSFGNVLGLLKPHYTLIIQILFASLMIQVFGLITPLFTQIILDQVVVQRSFSTLNVFAVGLLLFSLWRVGLVTVRQYLLDYFSNRLDLTLISGFVNHTLLLPLKFFSTRHVGDIITRVQESQKIQLFLTRQLIITWLDALMAVVYLGLMVYYNWQLTLLVLGLVPPIALLTLGATPLLRRVSREIFNEDAKENSTLVEMMTGISTIKMTATERELRWRWEDQLISLLNARFRGQKLSNVLQLLSGLINTIGSTALLWYGALLVIRGELTVGQFVAFNMLIGNVITPILGIVQLWDEFQEVTISIERLNDVFSAQPEESPHNPRLILPPVQGHIQFEAVTFNYGTDDERNTLQNLTFEVQAGETIAIVGRSGSGKTTLINLLQGLYHPVSGRISIDGHDLRHVAANSLRSQLGVVPQECFLFSGTILENITMQRTEFTAEQAIEAAKLAEAHSFIQALPLGYSTKVGERGSSLSGGQRQRIAIARALLGYPRILILDEATSSLDTESERRFQRNLAQISRDRTTLIIAHRLSTVRNADRILVLDRGILVEQGNHEELMAYQGLYYHLAQQQLDL